jgi:hypothetical protein
LWWRGYPLDAGHYSFSQEEIAWNGGMEEESIDRNGENVEIRKQRMHPRVTTTGPKNDDESQGCIES